MRIVALAILLAVLAAEPADACTISREPAASVFQPASGKAPGHQPWISLWNVKGDVTLKLLPAGTIVPVDRVGNYVRPKKALPDGARIQITQGAKLLTEITLSSEERILPAWSGIKLVSAAREAEGLCSPAGPVVRLRLEPTTVDLDDAVLLVYLSKPDRKKPHAKLARIIGLGGGGRDITMFNGLGEKAWLTGLPKQLWVAIADGDGHVGPAIKI
jgi:hypothetical protein